MGLDITAHRQMYAVECADPESGEAYEDDVFTVWINPDFPGRANGIPDGRAFKAAESFDFRAGSYGGYSAWRDMLSLLALNKPAPAVWAMPEDGPFVELIHFSDCEGVIGPDVSCKLAADFARYQTIADTHRDAYFREKYAAWRKAFEMASDNGCVCFH